MTHSSAMSRIRDIALADIDRSRNHRLPMPGDAERLKALQQSIEACGQLQPIRVYERSDEQKDKQHAQPYILGFGARRCAAMELLGRKTIRAIVFAAASYAEIAQARAVENLHRQEITPLEEVQAVSDVLEAIKAETTFTGDPYEEASTRLARPTGWIKDRDYLHRLTRPVQRFALQSGLPAGHLRELAKLGDPQEQMRLACEAAGAPSAAFPADLKEPKLSEWQRRAQDDYFAELFDGKIQRWPLSRLKDQVARVRLSLKIIPWQFDQALQFGATKLRKCAGCPHNSESDRTLFGIDEDAANPQGYCLNPSCYNAKHEAAEAAKEQVFKKIRQRTEQTPEAIRKIAPEWLSDTSVIGYVKRQLEKQAHEERNPAASTQKTRVVTESGRPLTEHEQALRTFAEAFQAWEGQAFAAILEGINADPVHKVNWCVLLGVSAFWEHPSLEIPRVQPYSGTPTTAEPVLPPLSEAVERVIQAAFKGTRNGWVELLKDCPQISPDERGGLGIPHPHALELLAEAMQVKLPPAPQWTAVKVTAAPTTEAAAVTV